MTPRRAFGCFVLATALFVCPFAARVHGISADFWLMHDQIGDWSLVQGSFRDLPVVGPERTGGGHHLGPAYYWWLWLTRVSIGAWTNGLPHAAGISVSFLDSLSFLCLGAAAWIAGAPFALVLATGLLLATCPYEAALARAGWNPCLALALVNFALALFVRWQDRWTTPRIFAVAGLAWLALQAHMACLGVVLALATLILARGAAAGRRALLTYALGLAAPAVLLQLPRVLAPSASSEPQATAVTETFRHLLSEPGSVLSAQGLRFVVAEGGSLLLGSTVVPPAACGAVIAASLVAAVLALVRGGPCRSIAAVSLVSIAASAAACTVIAIEPKSYWLVPVLGALALAVLAGACAVSDVLPARPRAAFHVAALAVALAALPARHRAFLVDHRYPLYRAVVAGSRTIVRRGLRVRDVIGPADDRFPTSSAALVGWLGGQLEPDSPWVARIDARGDVELERAATRR
ncbi:MAG TPA: hypothetical protein VFD92_05335 [Candidatus Binatia bacterium]|nr:hypothetical protein [Candidatus Binatia bacterium]